MLMWYSTKLPNDTAWIKIIYNDVKYPRRHEKQYVTDGNIRDIFTCQFSISSWLTYYMWNSYVNALPLMACILIITNCIFDNQLMFDDKYCKGNFALRSPMKNNHHNSVTKSKGEIKA